MQWFRSFKIESWTLYAVATSVALTRLVLRMCYLGVKNLQLDDYGMVLALLFYSALLTLENRLAASTGIYTDTMFTDPTPKEIASIRQSGKFLVSSEQIMQCLIYSLKACVLLMYSRLRRALKHDTQRLFHSLAIYTFLCWIGTSIALWTFCYPPSNYWAYPPPNRDCAVAARYYIVQTALNISSDIFILAIPLPALFRASLPLREKFILVFFYSLGIFVVIAAILTKVYSFRHPNSLHFISWYIREASTAVILTNLPVMLPVLRKMFVNEKNQSPSEMSLAKINA